MIHFIGPPNYKPASVIYPDISMMIDVWTILSKCSLLTLLTITMCKGRLVSRPSGTLVGWLKPGEPRPEIDLFFWGNIKVWALSWHSLQELGGYFVKRLLVNRCHSLGLSIERAKSGQKQVFPIRAIITLEIFQVGVCQMQVRFAFFRNASSHMCL